MLEMTIKYDYVVVDTDAWIADRTAGVNQEATDAYDAWREEHPLPYRTESYLTWLTGMGATGLYGENAPTTVCTVNEENFLSGDIVLTLAHTERYGSLLCVQEGYWTRGPVTFYSFIGDDDADAFAYSNGYAVCSCGGPYRSGACDAEWIIESACTIWQNGGGQTESIADVIYRDDNGEAFAICPRCHMGNLTFYAN